MLAHLLCHNMPQSCLPLKEGALTVPKGPAFPTAQMQPSSHAIHKNPPKWNSTKISWHSHRLTPLCHFFLAGMHQKMSKYVEIIWNQKVTGATSLWSMAKNSKLRRIPNNSHAKETLGQNVGDSLCVKLRWVLRTTSLVVGLQPHQETGIPNINVCVCVLFKL